MKRVRLCLALLLAVRPVFAEPAWPAVSLPEGVQRYDIGEQISADGTPLRIQGFVSPRPAAELAGWFRGRLGKPLVENTVAGKLVLGRPQGDFYLTVQLEQLARGTRGLVAVSHQKAAHERYPALREATERLLQRLPAGSRVVSQMSSTEGGRLSRYVVLANPHGVELNRGRVVDMLREDGLALQREARPAAGPNGARDGRTLFFQGQGRDAMAVLSPNPDGSTTVLLHTLTSMERFQ
jgi:hypothetical protein